ncbi:hypothetical protein BB558_004429 [Smittium angustum]|uniref:Ribosomal RNA methyltransferase SPB1-like C-terminal domain-containing protein n=1 Tax=Smittium angustum TaxID=133377 RepID=A0A2U1J325_SMIAN|nr:hypothetical protein BB558_004429 [Smittium angustum]
MQLNMTTPTEIGLDQGDATLFSSSGNKNQSEGDSYQQKIRKITSKVDMDAAADFAEMTDSDEELEFYQSESSDNSDVDIDDELDKERADGMRLDKILEDMYDEYTSKIRQRDSKIDIKRKRSEQDEFQGFGSDNDEKSIKKKNSASTNYNSDDGMDVETRKMRALDADDTDSDSSESSSSDSSESSDDESAILQMKKKAKQEKTLAKQNNLTISSQALSKKAALWFDQPLFKNLPTLTNSPPQLLPTQKVKVISDKPQNTSNSISDAEESDDDFTIVPSLPDVQPNDQLDYDPDDQTDYTEFATPEALTIAHDLINRKVTKNDLVDKYFNKNAFNDNKNLPSWFLDNERLYNKPNLPVTKQAMDMLRAKLKAINARPIKKVVEAKARKKLHASQKMAKLKSKAESLANNEDMTEAEKAKNIEKLMKSNIKKLANKKRKISVVVAKGGNKALKGRPKGTKGRYKMVDSRLKKDARAIKAKGKKGGKRH